MSEKIDRITIRLHPNQMQVLSELKDALGISYSLLTRAIICDFLTRNEEHLQNIVDGKIKIDTSEFADAYNTKDREED